ncbi:Myosin-2, partial [Ophiophagus hannah]
PLGALQKKKEERKRRQFLAKFRSESKLGTQNKPSAMSQSLQDTVENFKSAMEEMQGKVKAMRERAEEAYQKLNQLEVLKFALIDSNNQLNKELRKLSQEVALFEDQNALEKGHQTRPKKTPSAPRKTGGKKKEGETPREVNSKEKQ